MAKCATVRALVLTLIPLTLQLSDFIHSCGFNMHVLMTSKGITTWELLSPPDLLLHYSSVPTAQRFPGSRKPLKHQMLRGPQNGGVKKQGLGVRETWDPPLTSRVVSGKLLNIAELLLPYL